VGKFWSIVFAVVLLACGLSFVAAPFMGWWLPAGRSTHAGSVDLLFYVILWITAFFFFLTEAILVVFIFLYAGGDGTARGNRATGWPGPLRPRAGVLHDQHRVEMAWTIIPALILLYIAFAQIGTWADVKYQSRQPKGMQMEVSARQFEWRIRYPHPDRVEKWLEKANDAVKEVQDDYKSFARHPQADDVWLVNELHVWKDQAAVIHLGTRDVLHSFNIPVMRVKQDALPGKQIPVWFTAAEANVGKDGTYGVNPAGQPDPAYNWDLPCAELCGWGHYRMIGRVFVHPSREDYLSWLRRAAAAAHQHEGDRVAAAK
jgi:cytochrome c oxidase subunit 2